MKVTITKIFRTTKDKNGQTLLTKTGKEYERVGIKAREYGDQWISGFGGEWNRDWKVGDTVEIEVEKVGQYLNFKRLSPLLLLEERVARLEEAVFNNNPDLKGKSAADIDDNVADIPF